MSNFILMATCEYHSHFIEAAAELGAVKRLKTSNSQEVAKVARRPLGSFLPHHVPGPQGVLSAC